VKRFKQLATLASAPIVSLLYEMQTQAVRFNLRLGTHLRWQIAETADEMEIKDTELVRLAVMQFLERHASRIRRQRLKDAELMIGRPAE
jgi:hypothetical protein